MPATSCVSQPANRPLLILASIIIAALALFAAPGRAGAAPADLDPSFGTDGVVLHRLTMHDIAGATLQPDGKILVAGTRALTGAAIARLNSDGSLDTAFGMNGYLHVDVETADTNPTLGLESCGDTSAAAIELQEDGRIVVLASHVFASPLTPCATSGRVVFVRPVLIRLNPDGSLDTTFHEDGVLTTDFGLGQVLPGFGGDMAPFDLEIQPDGKYVVVARVGDTVQGFSSAVARFLPTGAPDTTFGEANGVFGVTLVPNPGDAGVPMAVEIADDGTIVVAGAVNGYQPYGTTAMEGSLFRVTPDGAFDEAFGLRQAGSVGADIHHDLEIQPDGKYLVGGRRGPVHVISRWNSDGTLDTAFGSDGHAVVNQDLGTSDSDRLDVDLDDAGRIVVTGWFRFGFLRLTTGGALDTSVSPNGRVLLPELSPESTRWRADAGLIQPDGHIVIVGPVFDRHGFSAGYALARFEGGAGETPPDTTPPETTLTAGPPEVTEDTTASFEFASDDPTVFAFQCRVDGGDWLGCISGYTVELLTPGSHLFEVRAVDPAGNVDPTPATWTWTVQAPEPPEPTVSERLAALQEAIRSGEARIGTRTALLTMATLAGTAVEHDQTWLACIALHVFVRAVDNAPAWSLPEGEATLYRSEATAAMQQLGCAPPGQGPLPLTLAFYVSHGRAAGTIDDGVFRP